jgi:hypothetical protein
MPLEHCHDLSVPLGLRLISLARANLLRRKSRCADEAPDPMFKRRRQTKKLLRVARMLRELDAASRRPMRPSRRSRAAISRV